MSSETQKIAVSVLLSKFIIIIIELLLLQVVEAQVNYGIDIITDGEIYRDVYVFHFLRQCDGVDFKNAEHTTYRNGACHATLPVVSGRSRLSGTLQRLKLYISDR